MEKKLPNEITFVIPAQEYNSNVYTDPYNCYIAQALKVKGFENVSVASHGETIIDNTKYVPKNDFSSHILGMAFDSGLSLEVTLVRN